MATNQTNPAATADQHLLRQTLLLAMVPGIGPRTLTALIDHFGTPESVLAARAEELRQVAGVGDKLAHRVRHAEDHVDVDAILQWCRDQGVQVIARDDRRYPRPLGHLCDAPPLLFVRGSLCRSDDLAVAIVGTRHATVYGRNQAERIAFGLARAGVTVVSGMARGIDAAAHRGALDADGRTLAVFGCGLAHIYPTEHDELAQRISGSGACLSEYHPQTKPHSGTFPQRNRLISGLCHATLIIEAPARSGSLITARTADEQGREVLALPGPVTARASQGTNLLIRDGARLIRNVDDVLECLGPLAQPVPTAQGRQIHKPAEMLLNDRERQVLDAINSEATGIDRIVQHCGLPVPQVLATISVLEMRKLVRRLSPQYVARA